MISVGGRKLFLLSDLEGLSVNLFKAKDSYITLKGFNKLIEIFL